MNLQKAIESFDNCRQNTISLKRKTEWISQLEYKIYEALKLRHDAFFDGYNASTPLTTELLAPEEYSEIYSLYLTMMLDFTNGEIGRYNNSAMLFNRMFSEMSDYINRREAVKKKVKIKAGDLYV